MRACMCSSGLSLESIPAGPCSLEKDLFPELLTQGMYAFEQDGMFIDIGTPEDYARAQRFMTGFVRPRCGAAAPGKQVSNSSQRGIAAIDG